MIAIVASAAQTTLVHLSTVDLVIIAFYFALVLGIGFYLKRFAKTGEDFFLAGREMTAWVAGLAFVSANLGSLELLGWAGSAYQYGILAAHWYWIGAIPAMVFLGIVMMPFYYISKTHSVPGYLQLRYGPAASALSAVTFAIMTILMSGVNMYAMAVVMKVVLGWDINFSIWVSSLTVGIYVAAGGLFSAIFNEVLQFFLIWFGALLIPILGLIETGGWKGMVARIQQNFPGQDFTHAWSTLGRFQDNPMGMHWTGIVFGLGAVQAMGYWTTDFLVVQRVLSAKDIRSAKMAPIIGSFFKMAVPLIVILPGLLGLAVLPMHLVPASSLQPGQYSYNEVLPLMLARYCGPGLLGLGITALVAGFMAGMAGNVSAFATVWTYDIYRPFLRKNAPDQHYVSMGRWCTLIGLFASIGTAYLAMGFASIMDYVQALFGFFIAPLFGTVLLGMLWKRVSRAAGFWGLLAGTLSSVTMFTLMKLDHRWVSVFALSPHAQGLAQDMYQALWSCVTCVVVTVLVTLVTKPRPDEELKGLVYALTEVAHEEHTSFLHRPLFWGIAALAVLLVLQIIFW
ncbi:MAG: Na+/galactose cotransporter [Acidobacteria bacterium 13_2_20CM_2_57_6]|nr:MAG: Na+/galactose cotransporter [Acidobacteria bacterium 13_2_20CM_2_57_6]PYT38742.1 MAG: Na+/galactose cotransporter [Acidobacteriota bacterium]PYT61979.1 MAG: Na+/galactose cotransporter [Acidobacteriota bacterium]